MNEKTFLKNLFIFIFCLIISISSTFAFNISNIIAFDEGYTPLFADFNIKLSDNGRAARLALNRYAGSGFISSKYYDYGFFSANIKLPGDYTAGVVVAFYTSNADLWAENHDELDIEFLGNLKGKPWRFQTNMYGNGTKGREERYTLWFDPTKNFHRYSILWTPSKIIFYVDHVPVREIVRKETMGGDYPSKPMSLYATIWDASSWATSGGRYRVKYEFQPFVSEFSEFVLDGCPVDPIEQVAGSTTSVECKEKINELEDKDYFNITPQGRESMKWFREKFMYYSYCYDTNRYPVPPPECVIVPTERDRFKDTGRLKFGSTPRPTRRGKRVGRARKQRKNVVGLDQQAASI